MPELLESKDNAVDFITFNVDEEAVTIVVTKDANGTYLGDRTFDENGPVPEKESATAAKSAAKSALDKDAAKVEITLQPDGKYAVAAT